MENLNYESSFIESHFKARFVLSGCMVILAVAGMIIVGLNNYSNYNPKYRTEDLTRSLWKFNRNTTVVQFSRQRIAWYKLVFAGIMMISLLTSFTIRFLSVTIAIFLAIFLYIIWQGFLFVYWHLLKAHEAQEELNKSGKEGSSDGWQKRINVKAANDVTIGSDSNQRENSFTNTTNEANADSNDRRLPVTVITGFLGAGKTTLVKEILQNTVGLKVLVIENEIGTEGIDHELLMQHTTKEDIILMNNGCICCNVRNDLLTTFHRMFANEAFAFLDWIVIETTGLADPAPLIQSFYMDSECQKRMRLDGVITVVDCKHLPLHLASHRKSQQATAAAAAATAGAHGGISEAVLQVTFADRIILNKTDLVSQHEVETLSRSLRELNPNAQLFFAVQSKVDMKELLNIRAFDPKKLQATASVADKPILIQRDEKGKILKKSITWRATPKRDASNAVVSTVSLVTDEEIDLDKFNEWIFDVMRKRGEDIFRLKGILYMHGFPDSQFVAHGIHMIFEGEKVATPQSKETTKPPKDSSTQRKVTSVDVVSTSFETSNITCPYLD